MVGNPGANPPVPAVAASSTSCALFQINNIKLYVPDVAFCINDNIKFLENLKPGFKRTISSNKYGSDITTQSKISNLDL